MFGTFILAGPLLLPVTMMLSFAVCILYADNDEEDYTYEPEHIETIPPRRVKKRHRKLHSK